MTAQPDSVSAIDAAETVRIPIDVGHSVYDIRIGSGELARAGQTIAALRPGARVAVVSDSMVAGLHLQTLMDALSKAEVGTADPKIVAPGEATKCFSVLEDVVTHLLDARIERQDMVIALGGGVVGDLAGFAASILRRGVDVVQIPTSLLAQVDSSVGGKTGIDTRHGKNLVGTFHQPALVIADTDVLDTLPERHFRAGYAEIAKYGLIGDADVFGWLETNWRDVFSGGPARLHAIAESCRAKARIVAEDEREAGRRALLNLGHTFGHAFEAATGYGDRLVHGEAIAIGMVLAFRLSERLGLCAEGTHVRVERHFEDVGLPTAIAHIPGDLPDADSLLDIIHQDKKVERGTLTFILAEAVGAARIVKDVAPDVVRDLLSTDIDQT